MSRDFFFRYTGSEYKKPVKDSILFLSEVIASKESAIEYREKSVKFFTPDRGFKNLPSKWKKVNDVNEADIILLRNQSTRLDFSVCKIIDEKQFGLHNPTWCFYSQNYKNHNALKFDPIVSPELPNDKPFLIEYQVCGYENNLDIDLKEFENLYKLIRSGEDGKVMAYNILQNVNVATSAYYIFCLKNMLPKRSFMSVSGLYKYSSKIITMTYIDYMNLILDVIPGFKLNMPAVEMAKSVRDIIYEG